MNSKGNIMNLNVQQIQSLAYGMGEMARTYPNDTVSNALARVSDLVANYGTPFAEKLTKQDMTVIQFYLSEKRKGKSQSNHAA